MLTLKFGGTSMGSAERILGSADIIIRRAEEDRLSVIASAVAGVSNGLQASIDACVAGAPAEQFSAKLRAQHSELCADLQSKLAGFDAAAVMQELEPLFAEYEKLLSGCVAFGECPDTVCCRIMGMGELLSTPVLAAVLRAKRQDAVLLDSRKFIFTTGCQGEGDPDYGRSAEALRPYRDGGALAQARILVFQGFICSWIGGTGREPAAGLLGRNGSDFSAAIVGSCLGASRVEFWTDVDGVFSADPRIVRDALLVDDMSYEEAMELAFFGSKVLHPKTLAPLAAKGIEAWSLNSHNPSARGTRIGRGPFPGREGRTICGISCLKRVAMVSVGGTGMRGRSGMASRIFAAVSGAQISVLLITQSSSEYTISFCVRDSEAARVQDVLKKELELEIHDGLIDPIDVRSGCAIVSVVGDGMIANRGIAAKFFGAISSQDINVVAIAQGSSERCISCVIGGECSDTAVRAVHAFFFNTAQTIEVFVFGAGTIGGALLDQIRDQQQKLRSANIALNVVAIANGRKMLLDAAGLPLEDWRAELQKAERATDVDEILRFVREVKPLNPVFVDCTASCDLPERYLDIINAGMSVATPNKRANSMKMEFYRDLRRAANRMHRRFLYETNVGAGLPIIDTLQNLFKSGDRLIGFSGIMSGSLSYIFGRLDEGVPFSKAVAEAKELRFTEPDPRDDLNGMDVARKALIIAREAGFSIELEDVRLEQIFPEGFDTGGTPEEFMARLPEIDGWFAGRIAALKAQGKVLRMGASIRGGACSVGMLEVGADDPLYAVKGGENAFVFHTERYHPVPLTVRG
ncbi:MAG: bifunctional aspartate kinase/homoserine dehydrogenase I [Treponemataceae bacterium]|nr:bifunctional aspartate kinase/homoserine dehydrogenase I [Treponemataceae bacterium]